MTHQTFPKPPKGAYRLERRQKRRDQKSAEDRVIARAKARDNYRCRYPGCHYDLALEGAHWAQHRQMGGNPTGDRTADTGQILSLCVRHHAELDRGEIAVSATTDLGADWAMQFLRRDESGTLLPIAEERAIGVSSVRGPA